MHIYFGFPLLLAVVVVVEFLTYEINVPPERFVLQQLNERGRLVGGSVLEKGDEGGGGGGGRS